jgi:hypothetical protein
MKMPMVDSDKEKMGKERAGMTAVKADAKSGPGHAPQSPKSVKSSGGPGISSEGMGGGSCGAAVRHLDGMKK